MSFTEFKKRIGLLVLKAGGGIAVSFEHDEERGLYSAAFDDGTVITAAPSAGKFTVNYGSGHCAMATI